MRSASCLDFLFKLDFQLQRRSSWEPDAELSSPRQGTRPCDTRVESNRGALTPIGPAARSKRVCKSILLAWAVALSLTQSLPAFAVRDRQPLEAADTSSPRATLQSFQEAFVDLNALVLEDGEYSDASTPEVRRVLGCLDLSQVPPAFQDSVGGEAAICLKEVLDRIVLPAWEEIPGEDQLVSEGALEPLARWRIPRTEITLSRVIEGPRQGEYLFDPRTVDRAKEFFLLVRDLPYQPDAIPDVYHWYLSDAGWMISDQWIRALPQWTRRTALDTPIWKWVALFLTVLALVAAMWLIYRTGRRIDSSVRETSILGYSLSLLFPIAAICIPVVAKYLLEHQIKLRGAMLNLATVSLNVIFLCAVIVVVLGISNRIAALIIAHPRIHPRGLDAQFTRVACRLLGMVAAVVVFLEGGKQLGIPLSTLLAGAGVGGLALALAAQDALKNLFGSMMIFLDKPYRVNERILTKGYDGVVEEIGLRSTKIRLLTGHQATIPNEDMARSHIENIGRRPHIRRIATIALELSTPPEKVKQAVEIIRRLLDNHEGMDPEYPPRVFFDEFNRDSLRVRVMYWYHPPDYWDYVAFGEKLNLQIMESLAAAGIRLALPASETHLATEDWQRVVQQVDPAKTSGNPS